jgi:hypothetical protein
MAVSPPADQGRRPRLGALPRLFRLAVRRRRHRIVGGPTDDNAAGAAWIYVRRSGAWYVLGSKLVGAGAVGPAGRPTARPTSLDALLGPDAAAAGVHPRRPDEIPCLVAEDLDRWLPPDRRGTAPAECATCRIPGARPSTSSQHFARTTSFLPFPETSATKIVSEGRRPTFARVNKTQLKQFAMISCVGKRAFLSMRNFAPTLAPRRPAQPPPHAGERPHGTIYDGI